MIALRYLQNRWKYVDEYVMTRTKAMINLTLSHLHVTHCATFHHPQSQTWMNLNVIDVIPLLVSSNIKAALKYNGQVCDVLAVVRFEIILER